MYRRNHVSTGLGKKERRLGGGRPRRRPNCRNPGCRRRETCIIKGCSGQLASYKIIVRSLCFAIFNLTHRRCRRKTQYTGTLFIGGRRDAAKTALHPLPKATYPSHLGPKSPVRQALRRQGPRCEPFRKAGLSSSVRTPTTPTEHLPVLRTNPVTDTLKDIWNL